MSSTVQTHSAICLTLTQAISRTRTVEEIYAAALEALVAGLGIERSSILLFDPDGVMRFKAWRGLSAAYRAAVEGHTPWTPDTVDPAPIVVADVAGEPSLAPYRPVIDAEGIAGMTFIPLVCGDRVIGKFMLYASVPWAPSEDDLLLARIVAAQVAFAVDRTRTEAQARRSEERLRFALDAASMGTWDWDLTTDAVRWSDNLERIHGLPAGTFDGTFASYEREIHPDDRPRVLGSVRRALADGTPHEVEYRLVAPDGTIRWCEGKGQVEFEHGRPVRMSGVCMMVTRRKEAELARLAAAEEASRLKDDFLATLSHELRTPMHAILGWTQLLQQDALGPERSRQAIDVIARNARLQAQLIEDVLDVSRIITGKLDLERGPVAMPALIETVVQGAMPVAEGRNITVAVRLAADVPPIEGDPRRLHQVLNNVLSNAVKFTPDGGRVTLAADVADGWLRLTIADTGVGIDPAFLPYVFDRFRQADSRATRAHGGLGLGLAITRHLVERHGGRIRAESPGAGRGTTVTILLPPAGQVGTASTASQAALAPDVRLDGVAALVVDDQDDSRALLATILEQQGATVVACASALEARERLAMTPVDLVVADIAMPGMDGYELLRRLRADGVRTPAMAVTAYARPDDRQRALGAGYGAYCAKPIDAVAFVRAAADLVARPVAPL